PPREYRHCLDSSRRRHTRSKRDWSSDVCSSALLGRSEQLLGRALGAHREDVIIATKFGMDARGLNGPDWGVRGSRRYIRRAVEGSLRRLGTDYIDLYQMHAPDPHTPIEETLAALHELVLEGKVRYMGSTHFTGWQRSAVQTS